MNDFTKGYIEAALWSSYDNDGDALEKRFSIGDIDENSIEQMEKDCEKFQKENAAMLRKASPFYNPTDGSSKAACQGHDFWLSRNGHGAGYFDRDDADVFDALQDAARACGEYHLFDDGGIVYGEAESCTPTD